MKIQNSSVSMASSHELEQHVSVQKASVEVRAKDGAAVKGAVAAIYESTGVSMAAAMGQYQKTQETQMRKSLPGQEKKTKEQWIEEQKAKLQTCPADFSADELADTKLNLLFRLLEVINGKGKHEPLYIDGVRRGEALDLRSGAVRMAGRRFCVFGMNAFEFSASIAAVKTEEGAAVGTSPAGTLWQRVNAVSTERSEREYTAFQSVGRAVTEDGRSINFNVSLAMSRSFTQRFEALSSETFVMTDPLIINIDSDTTLLGDMKFRFDLDADGREENISFAGQGSGFLALDANGNGVIDDGSELFGTKSGDGFADLAAYDEDGNGWIDENDDVYAGLRVWVKDADGGDRLLNLKEANVGAIYLGSADTEFSLQDEVSHETNGVIRRTGVYLRETGEAGTISHVDLRC